MKACSKCGYPNFKPKDECPKCGTKYDSCGTCNPLASATQNQVGANACNGYITTGDTNAKHNKD